MSKRNLQFKIHPDERETFIKEQGWEWFSNIHYVTSYTAPDTYFDGKKLYNIVVCRFGSGYFIKHINGLKVYKNDGGYYVQTCMGRVYVNRVENGELKVIGGKD